MTKEQTAYIYADEADMLNVVLFGQTAKQWRMANPKKKGNIRDYATLQQLLVLANMESYKAILISQKMSQLQRLEELRKVALEQLQTLSALNLSTLPDLPMLPNPNK